MVDSILKPIAEWVITVISSMGYPGIVLLMAIESACIPLPSEIIMPFSGYLVYTGRFDLHAASLAGALGCAVGSAAAYWVGIWGGRPFLEKYGRYVLIRRKDLDAADRFFERWGMWAVFIARLLPIIRTFISLPAGVAAMNFPRFVLYTFLGSLPWSFFLTYLGFKMGQHWEDLRFWFHRFDLLLLLVAAAAVAFYVWRKMRS